MTHRGIEEELGADLPRQLARILVEKGLLLIEKAADSHLWKDFLRRSLLNAWKTIGYISPSCPRSRLVVIRRRRVRTWGFCPEGESLAPKGSRFYVS